MITDCKRIRTRKGDNMMFATLDDLEGAVEMIVFAKGVEEYGAIIEGDGVLLVRGRVEHKDGGDIKLVPDDIKVYEPTPEELAAAAAMPDARAASSSGVTIEVAGHVPETFLDELKDLCRNNPGEHELELVRGPPAAAPRRGYRVSSGGLPGRAGPAARHRALRRLSGACRPRLQFCARGSIFRPPRGTARVPPVLLLLRPRRAPGGLHRVGLRLPLPVRRRRDRQALHGLHEQGLPRGDRGRRFEAAQRERHGFGGVTMTGVPMPQCRTTVEKAYGGFGDAFDCTNPQFFDTPVTTDPAFDIRDGL